MCKKIFNKPASKKPHRWIQQEFCSYECNKLHQIFLKTSKAANGCVEWNGLIVKGYGQSSLYGKKEGVHRIVFKLIKGTIGDLQVLHQCDNPICINPEHLFLGTHEDNMKDRNSKKRQAKGVSHGKTKVIDPNDLINQFNSGLNRTIIAKNFGISRTHVYRISEK